MTLLPPHTDRFSPALEPPDRPRLWCQIAILLAVAVVPDTVSAIHALFSDQPENLSVMAGGAILTSRSICVVAACLSLLYLGNEQIKSIGFRPPTKLDFALALFVFGVSMGTHVAFSNLIYDTFGEPHPLTYAKPQSIMDWYWFVLSHLSNGIAEELAIWGLLYTRLRRLWHKHEAPAILACAAAFASYHVYQGISPAISIFVTVGLVHGILYRITGRLWPLIIAHAASNLWFAS